MGEAADLKGIMFQAKGFVQKDKHEEKNGDHLWMNMEDDATTTSESSLGEYSRTSDQGTTSSSSELADDASSSTSNSSTNCNGPLYELSELMAQLPIKRGLSKYFQGKSQSFTSLSSAKSIEELAKKESPYSCRKKMKSSKSYGGALDSHKLYTLPRATIAKKVSRNNSLSSLSFQGRRSSFLSGRPPLIPVVQKNFSSV